MYKNAIKLLLLLGLLLGLAALLIFMPEGKNPETEISSKPLGNAQLQIQSIGEEIFGLSIVEEKELLTLNEGFKAEAGKLWYNGEKAAADTDSNTVYLSLSADNWQQNAQKAELLYEESGAALCFVDSPELHQIDKCIKEGTTLSLAVIKDGSYGKINVVLTDFPVMSVEGVFQKYGEAIGKDIMSGNVRLWDEEAFSSPVLWHYRGFGSMAMDKKAIKLTLMENRVDNIHCDLLGLGADDDWLLNPMNKDDLDIREKFAMDMWNGYFAPESWNYSMSEGRYVELVLNGKYHGLYYLQRRMDQKYLEIDVEKDILFKGRIGYAISEFLYELRSSPYSDNVSFTLLDNVLTDLGWHNLDMNNFIDSTLFLNYFATHDNLVETNMYFILEDAKENPKLYMVPWDTDMSLGMFVGKKLDYEQAAGRLFIRKEYEELSTRYPELDELLAERWKQLRQGAFSEENVRKLLHSNDSIAGWQAARNRDIAQWGFYNEIPDSLELLEDFCIQRLAFLDEYYLN